MQKNIIGQWQFYIITLFIILSSFIALTPKFLSRIFHYKNEKILNDFIQQTISSKKINAQKFWKMREFYCPGSFVFEKEKNRFLTYHCTWLNSFDSFINTAYLPDKSRKKTTSELTLISSDSFSIVKDKRQIRIIFILPLEEMKKANGFFDYQSSADQVYLKGNKFWLNKTKISL